VPVAFIAICVSPVISGVARLPLLAKFSALEGIAPYFGWYFLPSFFQASGGSDKDYLRDFD
jgi:hypothetical protein